MLDSSCNRVGREKRRKPVPRLSRVETYVTLSISTSSRLFFFPFLFYCFSLGWCSEHRHFQRTRIATMRSAAAHVSARQSTSNQLAIIDINKVISIVNVHQNEKQRNVPLIDNKNRYGFVKNVMYHGNCLKSSYHFVE